MRLTGIITTKEEQEVYNSWTKDQIYEAYLSEYQTRKRLEELNKQLQRQLAKIRYNIKQLEK